MNARYDNRRMRSVLALGLLACASKAPRDERTIAREAIARAATDVTTMTRLLRAPVVNEGVHFRDPSCAARFPPGEVEQDESTQIFQSQVSIPISDPATGTVIGAITVGVDVSML